MAKEKKLKETPQEEEQKVTLLATATEYDTVAYGEKLKLSDLQQRDIIKDIEEHIIKFKAQRAKEGLEQEWKDAIDLHEGNVEFKDFPHEDAHNLHIHLTSMVDDILVEKINKRTIVRPMMLAKARPGQKKYDKFVLQKKERFIEDKTFGEMKIEESITPIYEDAVKLGTGIGKLRHVREIEPVRMLEVYDPTMEDIARFVEDFADDKGTDTYKENLKTLQDRLAAKDKEPVTVWVEKEDVIRFQPVLEWVDPFTLYMDYYIKDIQYHRVIAEEMAEKSWDEIKGYFESGYFDKECEVILEDLKKKYPNNQHLKQKYTLIEANYRFKYKKSEIRSIVTYIKELPNRVAKAISFPYLTNKPNYVIYKIMNKRNSIYGTGIPKKLKDTNIAVNEYWNLQLDAAEFTVAPMMVANVQDSTQFDPSSKKFGPATIWWLGANDKIAPLDNNKNLSESYRLLSYLHQYAEWVTGVSSYMTGQQNTMDPNAPASKAYMLLQESNLRINSYIHKIDDANVGLIDDISQLYYQYFNDSIKYFEKYDTDEYESNEITRKELGTPVNWVPQLSDITVNKALEKEENFKIASFLLSQEMVRRLPKANRRIIEIILRSQGGEWEKAIDDLIPEGKETDIINKVVELLQSVGPQQVMDIMAQLMQQSMPPGAGQAMPMPGAPAEAQMVNPMNNMQGKVPQA